MYSLYLIALAYEIDPELTMTFIDVGACTAGLPQKNAKHMLESIKQKKAGKLTGDAAIAGVLGETVEEESESDAVYEDDKPQRDQVARQDKRPKFEAQMEEAIYGDYTAIDLRPRCSMKH
jgi:hypothetical protein